MEYYALIYTGIFILSVSSTEFSSCDSNCTYEDEVTLKCNYIPKYVCPGVSRVRIVDIEPSYGDYILMTSANFSSSSWNKVDFLELTSTRLQLEFEVQINDNCFGELKILRELHIHYRRLTLSENVFLGLNSVTTLDLSNCVRLSQYDLLKTLNGSKKLPGLRRLVLSNWNTLHMPFDFGETFAETLLPRNISHIDLSSVQILNLDLRTVFKTLEHLQFLNLSFSQINQFVGTYTNFSTGDLEHVKALDFSNASLSSKIMPQPPGEIDWTTETSRISEINPKVRAILAHEWLSVAGIVRPWTTVRVYNNTLVLDMDVNWFPKNFILSSNNLKRLDLRMQCENFTISSIEFWDLSENGLEFIHPQFFYCMPNLHKLFLSKNQLFKMVRENSTLFETLFSELDKLKEIDLSTNELSEIPQNMFNFNILLESLDLSDNTLQQVTFTLTRLENLQRLDLRNNEIKILDHVSMTILNDIPRGNDDSSTARTTVMFQYNPIDCSTCKAKAFLQWLIATPFTDIASQKLTCVNENGKLEQINGADTIDNVQNICDRKTIIISVSVSLGILLLIAIILTIVFYKRRRYAYRMKNRRNAINRLRDGDGQYEFVAFLAFSMDDHEFVQTSILHQLNETLQLMTGVERELVSTGDIHFRPGVYVHNEASRCLDTASVVLIVVSKNYCTSSYCRNELDQAYAKGKPIVLMFKEIVDVELMVPIMKELYQRNVRVLWTFENGEYVLKTTWENVCLSIIDLIECDK